MRTNRIQYNQAIKYIEHEFKNAMLYTQPARFNRTRRVLRLPHHPLGGRHARWAAKTSDGSLVSQILMEQDLNRDNGRQRYRSGPDARISSLPRSMRPTRNQRAAHSEKGALSVLDDPRRWLDLGTPSTWQRATFCAAVPSRSQLRIRSSMR